MVAYRKARSNDRDEVIDLANYVFSQAHCPHDFKSHLPKVYADKLDAKAVMDFHFVAEDDGKLKALVACPVLPLFYAGECFTIGQVGTVSVHPYSRGSGYFRKLMEMLIEENRQKGTDMLILGGLHQRYQHFGFEFAGGIFLFQISESSVRHSWGDLNTDNIRLSPMTADDENLDAAFALYEKEPVTGLRTRESFYDCCVSWNYALMAIMADEKFAGYFIVSPEGNLSELVLADESLRNAVLKKWSLQHGKLFTMEAAPYQVDRISDWMVSTERFTFENEELILVLRWLPVLRAAMALRCAGGNAADGEAVLDLDGKKYLIRVKDGKSQVEETDRAADTAPLCGIEAVRRVFGLGCAVCPGLGLLQNNWLPLPFNIPFTDKF